MISTTDDHSPREREIIKEVVEAKKLAERAQKSFIDKANEHYGLHRNYRRLVTAHSQAATQNDRDEVMGSAQREWGAELFIPYAFTTVETVVPRVLLNDPEMQVRPLSPDVPNSALAGIKALYTERQEEIGYELILQPTARRGFKYGLGVQKTFWNFETRNLPRVKRGVFGNLVQKMEKVTLDDGPMAEDVDVFDFFWDPVAKNVKTCAWVIHRTWRNMRYIRDKIEQGMWRKDLDMDAVARMGSETARGNTWKERMASAGIEDYQTRHGRLHEVWEYHDGTNVHTVLDGKLLVASMANPFHHRELPFQIFRPTIQEGEFVGIGEIEPIKHLQYELNALRSQRRDNATLVLQKAFMYAEGLVDPADLVVGPGVGIPTMGSPREVLEPINIGEIPNSGYQEEAALKEDMERTSGISDPVAGGGGGDTASSSTATGMEIVQSALNIRISLKSKNLMNETVKPASSQWLALYRQRMRKDRDVRVEDPSTDTGFAFVNVGRKELEAEVEVIPVAGSTEPENLPQKRNDALAVWNQLNGNPEIDQRKGLVWLLDQLDVPDPESFLTPQNPQLDAELVGQLAAVALGPEKAMQFVQTAMEEQQAMEQEKQGEPAQNGGPPQPAEQGAPNG